MIAAVQSPATAASRWKAAARLALACIASGAISYAAWLSEGGLILLLALPFVLADTRTRWGAFAVAASYFAVGNREIPAIIGTFFEGPGILTTWGPPVALTAIQSIPFLLFNPAASPNRRFVGMLAALLVLTFSPVGWLAWRSPLFIAGLLMPGLGIVGLLLTMALFAGLASGGATKRGGRLSRLGGVMLPGMVAVLALTATLHYPVKPSTWVDVDTEFATHHRPKAGEPSQGAVLADMLQYYADSGFDVVVLPESMLSPSTPADQVALAPVDVAARRAGVSVLLGSVELTGEDQWRNTVVSIGARRGFVDESRLPMPMGNWRLGMPGGVPARPFASDLVQFQDRQGTRSVAMSICFEDTVFWPHWGLLTWQADQMVSMGNMWALTDTATEQAQALSASMLAKLAGVPLVRATNRWRNGR